MRATSVNGPAATGPSSWIPIDNTLNGFGMAISCVITSGASLTYKVQYTFDDPWLTRQCKITRASTTATVTLTAHGLTAGDSVVVQGSGSSSLDGTYAVASVTNANVFTYTVADSGLTAANHDVRIVTLRVKDHADITGETTTQDGNIAYPARAVRVNNTVWASGLVTLTVVQGRK
jgi:hypothetical protein